MEHDLRDTRETEVTVYRSIVVPLDGSEFAEHAMPSAIRIARDYGATLHLVHVHVPMPAAHLFEVPLVADTFEAEAETRIREYLAKVAKRVEADGINVTTSYSSGLVVTELRAMLEKKAADLVVMTTHGRGGVARLWIGSTADALMRETTVPMLLLRPGTDEAVDVAPPAFQRILVALDGSPEAEQVLPHAISVGQAGCTELRLLRVAPPMVPLVYPALHKGNRRGDELEKDALTYLGGVTTSLESSGARVTVDAVTNVSAAQAILEYAETENVDLIAMATQGLGGVRRMLIGSVADKVLRGTTRPVLLVRPA